MKNFNNIKNIKYENFIKIYNIFSFLIKLYIYEN